MARRRFHWVLGPNYPKDPLTWNLKWIYARINLRRFVWSFRILRFIIIFIYLLFRLFKIIAFTRFRKNNPRFELEIIRSLLLFFIIMFRKLTNNEKFLFRKNLFRKQNLLLTVFFRDRLVRMKNSYFL